MSSAWLTTLGREFCDEFREIPDICGQDAYEVFVGALGEEHTTLAVLRVLTDAQVRLLCASAGNVFERKPLAFKRMRAVVDRVVAHWVDEP
jgi:hypothetical protein